MFRLARTISEEDASASVTICFKRVTTFRMRPSLTRALAQVPARITFVGIAHPGRSPGRFAMRCRP